MCASSSILLPCNVNLLTYTQSRAYLSVIALPPRASPWHSSLFSPVSLLAFLSLSLSSLSFPFCNTPLAFTMQLPQLTITTMSTTLRHHPKNLRCAKWDSARSQKCAGKNCKPSTSNTMCCSLPPSRFPTSDQYLTPTDLSSWPGGHHLASTDLTNPHLHNTPRVFNHLPRNPTNYV
jgi:hypothetical protein